MSIKFYYFICVWYMAVYVTKYKSFLKLLWVKMCVIGKQMSITESCLFLNFNGLTIFPGHLICWENFFLVDVNHVFLCEIII